MLPVFCVGCNCQTILELDKKSHSPGDEKIDLEQQPLCKRQLNRTQLTHCILQHQAK